MYEKDQIETTKAVLRYRHAEKYFRDHKCSWVLEDRVVEKKVCSSRPVYPLLTIVVQIGRHINDAHYRLNSGKAFMEERVFQADGERFVVRMLKTIKKSIKGMESEVIGIAVPASSTRVLILALGCVKSSGDLLDDGIPTLGSEAETEVDTE